MAASNRSQNGLQNSVPVTKLSKLDFKEVLGCGRYGQVIKAEHKDWGTVAVKKLIDANLVPEKVLGKLKHEVDKIKGLGHENIINILGIVLEESNYCLILKYMENGSLEDFMSNERVGWPLKVRMTKEVILGMNYLHKISPVIIHRDLKSQNILVDGYIHVKISDFGIAEWKTYSRQYSIQMDQRNQKKGTITHIPPESWKDINMKANSKFDVYSFGILLWEIMTEKSPFEGANEHQIPVCIENGQRPDESCILPGAPEFMKEMMRACWHQDPDQRPIFSELKEKMDSMFGDYKDAADREESDLRRKQKEHRPPLASNVQEDTAYSVARQMSAIKIKDQPASVQESGASGDAHMITSHSPLRDDKKPVQRNTDTLGEGEKVDWGVHYKAQNEARQREKREQLPYPTQRFTETQGDRTDYNTHQTPLRTPIQRHTMTIDPETDYNHHRPQSQSAAQRSGIPDSDSTVIYSRRQQNPVISQTSVERSQLTEDGTADTSNIQPYLQYPVRPTSAPIAPAPIHSSVAPSAPVADDSNIRTDANPDDSASTTHTASSARGATGGNAPAQHTPPFDPTKGFYPTGPDNFPGQHVPDPDGQGYLYYPMPNMAPIHIAVPPNPGYKHHPNPMNPSAKNSQQIIHKHRNGGTTTIYNLNGMDNVQIGDHNVVQISSGSSRPRAGTPKTKAVKKIALTESTRKITDADIRVVALHLGKDWKMLGRTLGLTEGQIDGVNHDFQTDGLSEKIYQMIRLWRSTKGVEATAKTLADKLTAIHRVDVAVKIPK